MPLETGTSRAAFEHNVRTEVEARKPQKQAVAIAYREAGERKDGLSESLHPFKKWSDADLDREIKRLEKSDQSMMVRGQLEDLRNEKRKRGSRNDASRLDALEARADAVATKAGSLAFRMDAAVSRMDAGKASPAEIRHAEERVERCKETLKRARSDQARRKAQEELGTAERALKAKLGR